MHHYTWSGLDNVYLLSGYEEGDDGYGPYVSFEDGIDVALGKALIGLPRPLNGVELRVLRHHLDMTQPGLARVLGVSTITLRRWELATDAPIDRTADRLFRLYYAEKQGIALAPSDVAGFLASGRPVPEAIYLECEGGKWSQVPPEEANRADYRNTVRQAQEINSRLEAVQDRIAAQYERRQKQNEA